MAVYEGFVLARAFWTKTASCGHLIVKGDLIGLEKNGNRTKCERCMEILRRRVARKRHERYMETVGME